MKKLGIFAFCALALTFAGTGAVKAADTAADDAVINSVKQYFGEITATGMVKEFAGPAAIPSYVLESKKLVPFIRKKMNYTADVSCKYMADGDKAMEMFAASAGLESDQAFINMKTALNSGVFKKITGFTVSGGPRNLSGKLLAAIDGNDRLILMYIGFAQ